MIKVFLQHITIIAQPSCTFICHSNAIQGASKLFCENYDDGDITITESEKYFFANIAVIHPAVPPPITIICFILN